MEKTYVFEGKTTNEAIEKGLNELKVPRSRVEIKVLESEDKRSFFSILTPRVVKVEMTLKDRADNESFSDHSHKKVERKLELDGSDIERIKEKINAFVVEFIDKLQNKNVEYSVEFESDRFCVNLNGEDIGYLIGYRGDVLNAFQTIISNIANKDEKEKIRVILNINGYREKRKKDLEILADKIAHTVVRTRKQIVLEPMSSYERKIIHSKLQDNSKVKTHSIGEEPYRKVVVSLK